MLHGEIVTGEDGKPVVGRWETVVDPETWQAVDAIMRARRGRSVMKTGAVGPALAVDFMEHKYLLSGILRCGRSTDGGSLCNTPLRVRWVGGPKDVYHYICQPKSQGGCSGVGRDGAKTDEYVSEMVLAKLEQRDAYAVQAEDWAGAAELEATQGQLDELGRQWRDGGISNEFFFANVRHLEERLARLRTEQGRHAATARRTADVADIRRRWYADVADGGLDLMQKRAYIREALHAVIVHPVKKRGRAPFDPDLLEPIWRQD